MDWNMFWVAIGSIAAIVTLIYLMLRNFKTDMKERFDKIDVRFDKIDVRFDKIDEELKEIRSDITDIKVQVGTLEGSFTERGQWEGRLYSMQKIMSEEKK